jgi:ABC-type transporter Mla maintaining outer membrane lipid asymmetry ATPase subunit MlaF
MELQTIKDKIIVVREQQVILDSDVAELYGVETKRINEAVKNNPDKFPERYILYLSMDEAICSRSKI